MTEVKEEWTKGPWEVGSSWVGSGTSPNGAPITAANGLMVVRMPNKADRPLSQKIADARLISAAPDLAEAADHIARTGTDIADDMVVISGTAYRLIRAALQKARGQ